MADTDRRTNEGEGMQLTGGLKFLLNALLIVALVAGALLWTQSMVKQEVSSMGKNIMGEVCANRRVLYRFVSGESDVSVSFDTGCGVQHTNGRRQPNSGP